MIKFIPVYDEESLAPGGYMDRFKHDLDLRGIAPDELPHEGIMVAGDVDEVSACLDLIVQGINDPVMLGRPLNRPAIQNVAHEVDSIGLGIL